MVVCSSSRWRPAGQRLLACHHFTLITQSLPCFAPCRAQVSMTKGFLILRFTVIGGCWSSPYSMDTQTLPSQSAFKLSMVDNALRLLRKPDLSAFLSAGVSSETSRQPARPCLRGVRCTARPAKV